MENVKLTLGIILYIYQGRTIQPKMYSNFQTVAILINSITKIYCMVQVQLIVALNSLEES